MSEKEIKNINVVNSFNFKNIFLTAAVFILGALSLATARFILVKDTTPHYHANFALYVNGERDLFDSFVFYEEVSACSGEYVDNPKSRVHMHDKKNDLVHVHDNAVTWGHFFSNLGYVLTDNLLIRPSEILNETSENKLTFILNGKEVSSIADKLIVSADTLLINYGNETVDAIQQKYDLISRDAVEYNEKPDPSSCRGSNQENFRDRMIRTLTK